MNKNGYLSLSISIIAIALSGYATFICDQRIEADWMGILVGILSLLVTVLIGWNISTKSITIHKELKEELLSTIVEVQKPKSIKGFQKIVELVASITVFGDKGV